MAIENYNIGYTYQAKFTYPIQFTYYNPSINPPISGPTSVVNIEPTVFNVDTTNFSIGEIIVTNATGVYDSTNDTITITNPIGNVSVLVKAKGPIAGSLNNYWCLEIAGSHGGSGDNEYGSAPISGTVSYIDAYGDNKVLDISTLGLIPGGLNQHYYTPNSAGIGDQIMAGTPIVFSNIVVGVYNYASGDVRISYFDTSSHTIVQGNYSNYTVNASYVTTSNSIILRSLL